MARRRLISPEFFQHRGLATAESEAQLPLRVAFAGLWCQADRRGAFEWDADRLKLSILPWDQGVEFSNVLTALEERGFVCRYQSGGRTFGVIPSFARWQTFNVKERPTERIPDPPAGLADTMPALPQHHADTVPHSNEHGADMPGTGTGTGTGTGRFDLGQDVAAISTARARRHASPASDGFADFWSVYPKRSGGASRSDAQAAWTARRREGVVAADMIEGARRYAAYAKATGKIGTEYVKQPKTFLGPGRHWEETWEAPAAAVDAELVALAAAARPEAYANAGAVRAIAARAAS